MDDPTFSPLSFDRVHFELVCNMERMIQYRYWYQYTNSNWYGYDDIILNNQYYTSNNINININIDIISISISNTWIWTKKCGGSERKQHDSIISIRCLHICFNFDLRPRYQSSAATFSFRIRATSLYFPWAEA